MYVYIMYIPLSLYVYTYIYILYMAVSILFCVQDVSHNTKVQRERLLENCVNVL